MRKSDDMIFVGREEELQDLTKFARNAFSGKAGVVFVAGEAGIGKTSLVEELCCRLREEDEHLVVATGRCKRGSTSYFPFRSILEDLLVLSRRDPNSVKDLRDTIREVVSEVIQEIGVEVVRVFFPAAAAKIIEQGFQQDFSEIIGPKDLEQVQMFGWYTQIIKAISRQFPLGLFLDDLHLADISSLHLLFHLGRELKTEPVFVIGAYRAPEAKPDSLLTQIKHTLGHLLPIDVHRPHEAIPDSFLMQMKTDLERYGAKEFSLDVSIERAENREKSPSLCMTT